MKVATFVIIALFVLSSVALAVSPSSMLPVKADQINDPARNALFGNERGRSEALGMRGQYGISCKFCGENHESEAAIQEGRDYREAKAGLGD